MCCDAQVLDYVTNGSFEAFVNDYAMPNLGWTGLSPKGGAFYVTFSTKPGFSNVPHTGYGYQFPKNGGTFVGIETYCSPFGPYCQQGSDRMYLTNVLVKKLVAGEVYCVSFYINQMESSTIASSSYGAYFGGLEMDTIQNQFAPFLVTPHIQNPASNFITDTVKWIKVEGTYTATGKEKSLTIGNFNDISNTPTINPSNTYTNYFVNTYVDQVACIPLNLPADAGKDVSCVFGQSVHIGRPSGNTGFDDKCYWFILPGMIPIDTAAGLWVSVARTTTFVVKQEICGLVKFDTVTVFEDHVGIEINDKIDTHWILYPNPGSNNVYLEIGKELYFGDLETYEVYNIIGTKILEGKVNFEDRKMKVNIDILNSGTYIFTLKFKNKMISNKKLIVN